MAIILFVILTFIEAKSVEKITVMLSQSDPSIRQKIGNFALQHLEAKLLENFGKKFKLKIEYIMTNETLNFIFSSKTRFKRFRKSAKYS